MILILPLQNMTQLRRHLGIFQHNDDGISSQEHLGDEPVSVHWLLLRFTFLLLLILSPHFLDIFQNHVAVAIESLDSTKEFSVVPIKNQLNLFLNILN